MEEGWRRSRGRKARLTGRLTETRRQVVSVGSLELIADEAHP